MLQTPPSQELQSPRSACVLKIVQVFKLSKVEGPLNSLSDCIHIIVSHTQQFKIFHGFDFMATQSLFIIPDLPRLYHSVTL